MVSSKTTTSTLRVYSYNKAEKTDSSLVIASFKEMIRTSSEKTPLKYRNAHSGVYHVQNKEKYLGQYEPHFKSLLECKMMFYLDHNPYVVKWNYEPMPIKYIDESTGGKVRNYYIDFTAIVKTKENRLQTVWIEVKSESETRPPTKRQKNNQLALKIWIKNQSKWKAAKRLAESRGIKFLVISERELENG